MLLDFRLMNRDSFVFLIWLEGLKLVVVNRLCECSGPFVVTIVLPIEAVNLTVIGILFILLLYWY